MPHHFLVLICLLFAPRVGCYPSRLKNQQVTPPPPPHKPHTHLWGIQASLAGRSPRILYAHKNVPLPHHNPVCYQCHTLMVQVKLQMLINPSNNCSEKMGIIGLIPAIRRKKPQQNTWQKKKCYKKCILVAFNILFQKLILALWLELKGSCTSGVICQPPWVWPTALLSSCAESKALGCKTTKHRGLINGESKMFPCALSALDRLGCWWPCCSQVLTVKQLLLLLLPGLLGYKSINTWLVVTAFFSMSLLLLWASQMCYTWKNSWATGRRCALGCSQCYL